MSHEKEYLEGANVKLPGEFSISLGGFLIFGISIRPNDSFQLGRVLQNRYGCPKGVLVYFKALLISPLFRRHMIPESI